MRQRQGKSEDTADTFLAFEPDYPFVPLYCQFAEGQAESSATYLTPAYLAKFFEDAFMVGRGNTHPAILHPEDQPGAIGKRRVWRHIGRQWLFRRKIMRADGDFAARRRKLDRIVDQILQHAHQLLVVGLHQW